MTQINKKEAWTNTQSTIMDNGDEVMQGIYIIGEQRPFMMIMAWEQPE